MSTALERFLDRTAKRGSRYGGGSASAFACALAAALLEKVLNRSGAIAPIRALRTRCLTLVDLDAEAFARVVRAHRRHDRLAAGRALKDAIDIPVQIYLAAVRVRSLVKRAGPSVDAHYRSDLQCAAALASASQASARALIAANLRWLGDPLHARRVRQRLARLA